MHVLDNRDHLSWGDAHLPMLTAEHHTHTQLSHYQLWTKCAQKRESGEGKPGWMKGLVMTCRLTQGVEWHSVSLRDKVAAKRPVS